MLQIFGWGRDIVDKVVVERKGYLIPGRSISRGFTIKTDSWEYVLFSLFLVSAAVVVLPYCIFGSSGYHLKTTGWGYGLPKTPSTWFLFTLGFAVMLSVAFAWHILLRRNPLKVRCPECGSVAESYTSSLGLKMNFWLPGVYMKCRNCNKKVWMEPIR